MATGIQKRHQRDCRSRDGGECNCRPAYEASAYSRRDKKRITKRFDREAAAKAWRRDAQRDLAAGSLRAPKPTTVSEAWTAWEAGAKDGSIRERSGNRYKPSALRAYERHMRLRILPALGAVRLADIRRPDLQDLADKLLADGSDPSTIQGSLLPLRAIYKRAISKGELAVNPCAGLTLPAVRGRRERFASPKEAEALIAAAPKQDRPVWATAMFAGLRRGELMALRIEDVDLAAGVIRVEQGWDDREGPIELKSNAGRRKVPIPSLLRDHLMDTWLGLDTKDGLLFGRTPSDPFRSETLQERADKAWKAAGLERITPHECRHTFASLMIAAGVNAKALSTYMGHANISITLDRYGHLMPGSEGEAAELLDNYLTAQRDQADDKARAADGIGSVRAEETPSVANN